MSINDPHWLDELPDNPDSLANLPQFTNVVVVNDETFHHPDTPMLDAIKRNITSVLALGLSHFNPAFTPSAPKPQPVRKATAADHEALAKADAKRARRADRNKLKGL